MGFGELAVVFFSTLAIYVFLVVAFRVLGRRQLDQLTALDLVILILLGSAVETAMVHGSTSLKAGFVSATALFVANKAFSILAKRFKRISRLCGSGPLLLVHDGKFVDEHLKRAGLTHDDVMQALRSREHDDLTDVRFAVLEPDGDINVVSRFSGSAA